MRTLRNDCKQIANPKIDNWFGYEPLTRQSRGYKRHVKKMMRRRRRLACREMLRDSAQF